MIQTACPLDCYDACAITCDPNSPDKLVASSNHPTSNGALCALLNKYMHESKRIETPRINGIEVSMQEALDAVAVSLQAKEKLLWIGSGNLGLMQRVTTLIMDRVSGYRTTGSLCDGAGQAGILEGRGYNYQLPPEQIAKSDVVVVWGRNLTVTNSHILPFIEGKKLIVIDPVSTPIAKKADIHLQIQPRSDFLLAIMLARFIYIENLESHDSASLDALEEFYEFTQEFRIKSTLETIGIDLNQIGDMIALMTDKKVVFLLGAGVQKYSIGHYAFWAIDSLATTMGLFGKEGCGVSFLGNSRQGFDEVFAPKSSTVSIVNTPFEKFDTVLVQGGNPGGSMPDSNRVEDSLKCVKNLIYFGLYENETSAMASIVIPAKNFLEKDDIRLSYGHQYITDMSKAIESNIGISEYDFTKEIFQRLDLDGLEPLHYYLDKYKTQYLKLDIHNVLPDYQEIPYQAGFGKDGSDDFVFIDDFDDDFDDVNMDGYWLLSPKSSKSLNTQFQRNDIIRMPATSEWQTDDKVLVKSKYGECHLRVEIDGDLLPNCVIIASGTFGLNNLTPPIISQEGGGACYQEVKVTILKMV